MEENTGLDRHNDENDPKPTVLLYYSFLGEATGVPRKAAAVGEIFRRGCEA